MDRAEAGFRRALALDPSSLAARFGLASVLLDNGATDEAAAVTAQMAPDASDRAELLWLQARLAYGRGDASGAQRAVTRLLHNPHLQPAQQAEASLLLGLALGDLGESADAFAMARLGKRIQRESHAAQAAGHESEPAKLSRLGAWLATNRPTGPSHAADCRRGPVRTSSCSAFRARGRPCSNKFSPRTAASARSRRRQRWRRPTRPSCPLPMLALR